MKTVLALGAERQAATSLACAYPDHAVTFASDCDVIDGWDLPNVRMVRASPADADKLSAGLDHVVPLCPRWLAGGGQTLSTVFERLECLRPGTCIPVGKELPARGRWVVKGDRWHRPDAPLAGGARELADIEDVHGCGLVYQQQCDAKGTVVAIGHREGASRVHLGCVEVFAERFFRDDVLQAGETIDTPAIVQASLDVLDALDHRGFFTLNWLRMDEGLRLSSFRPVPRAALGTLRRAGADLLAPALAVRVAAAGLQFIADPHYASFEWLRT